MRLILTGDLHIGRSSTRIPEDISRNEMRTTAAWKRIVDLAVKENVEIVCLSGDIADQNNGYLETVGPLAAGINQLAENKITTVAVSGNHDSDVLARLHDDLNSKYFKLLGRNGKWERYKHNSPDGKLSLCIDGWSFPDSHIRTSPMDSYNLDNLSDIPVLGMVHGDLYNSNSIYAPLATADLDSAGPDAWLLGHIHVPALINNNKWILYPGSPQAMDPGESGNHGIWTVDIENGNIAQPEHRQLSSVWYDNVEINLDGAVNEAEIEQLLTAGIQKKADEIIQSSSSCLIYIGLRVRLVGCIGVTGQIDNIAQSAIENFTYPFGNGGLVRIEKIDILTLPNIDINAYGDESSAVAAVARLLRELRSREYSEGTRLLIRDTVLKMGHEADGGNYKFLDKKQREVSEELACKHLQSQGIKLLTELEYQIS